jgi:ABC-type polysaccharide/polyol phosphate transport system ATPase subunit
MTVLEFQNVSKCFARHTGRMLFRDKVKTWVRSRSTEPFFALKNVSFQVESGAGLAVVGANGAGKSTLLSLAAGLARPDQGRVNVAGRIAPLLELGSGFHPDLTGLENITVNASLIGLTRKRTREVFDQVVEFAGISDFLGEPLRTYSTGMVMRLAFSVAIHMDPDLLLIDEVLAVGDAAFQQKCLDRIHEFRANGGTLVCVSHASGMVQRFCDQAIWLDHGELMLHGPLAEVVSAYEGQRAVATV